MISHYVIVYVIAITVLLSFSDKEQICDDVLSNVTEGVCRPLRNRVEHILLSEHGAVILYRLTNLIR